MWKFSAITPTLYMYYCCIPKPTLKSQPRSGSFMYSNSADSHSNKANFLSMEMCADNDGFVVIKSGKSYNNIMNTVCVPAYVYPTPLYICIYGYSLRKQRLWKAI